MRRTQKLLRLKSIGNRYQAKVEETLKGSSRFSCADFVKNSTTIDTIAMSTQESALKKQRNIAQ